ncbi:MAG: hypothetical protein GDA54_03385 [Alphaproteobacteria bacterium GM7ARS4]|nr:hypothetical protein [Alphaproteobacteria bacterium GM7ARS4]
MPQLDATFYPSQILWLFLVASALYVFTRRYLMPQVEAIMQKRQEHIEHHLNQARMWHSEATKKQEAYHALIQETQDKTQKILQKEKEDMLALRQEKLDALKAQLHSDMERTEKQLRTTQKEAHAQLQKDMAQIVVSLLDKTAHISITEQEAQETLEKLHQ